VTIAKQRLDNRPTEVPDIPSGIHRHQNLHVAAFPERIRLTIVKLKVLNSGLTVTFVIRQYSKAATTTFHGRATFVHDFQLGFQSSKSPS
jgi:hypothetical protein